MLIDNLFLIMGYMDRSVRVMFILHKKINTKFLVKDEYWTVEFNFVAWPTDQ